MTGKEDCRAPLVFLPEDVPHLGGTVRVESGGRFVEYEQIRLASQCHPEDEPLGHPLRVVGGFPVCLLADADPVKKFDRVIVGIFRADGILDVLATGQALEHRVSLGQHADALPGGHARFLTVVAEYRHRAVGRFHEVEQGIDERRLPSAVRAEEAKSLTRFDREVDSIQCDDCVVAL